jgi:hypothetical protein
MDSSEDSAEDSSEDSSEDSLEDSSGDSSEEVAHVMTKISNDDDFFVKNRDGVVFYVRSFFVGCPVFSLFTLHTTIFCVVMFFLCSLTLQRFFVWILSIGPNYWWHML